LSGTTTGLYAEIPERVRITYYISTFLRDKHPGPAAIEDFLREIASASRGRITTRSVDPTKNPAEAESYGVAPQQMQIVEQSEQRVALVYTGIVVEYLDRYKTLPAIISTETLEYEIVKAIRAVVNDRIPVAGLLIGDDDKTLENDYRTLAGALSLAGYRTRQTARGQAVDDDVSVLFVIGNAAMDRYDAYFVDQYLMRGGRAFFAVKGVEVNPDYGLAATPVAAGGMLSVLSAYGIDVRRELVLDQSNLSIPFQTQGPTGGVAINYIRYPHWIALDARFANPDNPVTARFGGLDLFWPSPMTTRSIDGVSIDELIKTTPRAWKQTKDFAAGPDDVRLYDLERAQTEGQYLVAVAVAGTLPSAFANGDLPAREGAPLVPAPRARSEDTRIVVVSSGDFLTDLMKMSDSGFNASFAVSAADWLGSDGDLVAIRSRATQDLRLNRIKDEGIRAFLKSATYAVNLFLVPLVVIAAGVLRSRKRSRREKEARSLAGGEA
ncbi:MAG: ABC transporter, partial [Spirochaetales bacterium]